MRSRQPHYTPVAEPRDPATILRSIAKLERELNGATPGSRLRDMLTADIEMLREEYRRATGEDKGELGEPGQNVAPAS